MMEKLNIDPDDFQGYGEEMIDLVKQVKTQADEIENLKGETNIIADNTYYGALDRAVPNWQAINRDLGFLAWLNESDGLSGRTRQENLTQAHNALDTSTVIKYFLSYKGSGGPNLLPFTNPSHLPPQGSQPVVTRAQFNQAVQDRIQNKITDDQFEVISAGVSI